MAAIPSDPAALRAKILESLEPAAEIPLSERSIPLPRGRGAGDIFRDTSWPEAIRILSDLGFRIASRSLSRRGHSGAEDEFILFWHPAGALAMADSHTGYGRERTANRVRVHLLSSCGHGDVGARSAGSFPGSGGLRLLPDGTILSERDFDAVNGSDSLLCGLSAIQAGSRLLPLEEWPASRLYLDPGLYLPDPDEVERPELDPRAAAWARSLPDPVRRVVEASLSPPETGARGPRRSRPLSSEPWIELAHRVEGLASRWPSSACSSAIASWGEALDRLADGDDPASLDYASLLSFVTPGGLHFLRALSCSLRIPGAAEAFSLALRCLPEERLESLANLPDAAGCTLGLSFFEAARKAPFGDEEPDFLSAPFSELSSRLGSRLALANPALSALGLLISGSSGPAAAYSFQRYPESLPDSAASLLSIAWRDGSEWALPGLRAPFCARADSASSRPEDTDALSIPDPQDALRFLLALPGLPAPIAAVLEARLLSLSSRAAPSGPAASPRRGL